VKTRSKPACAVRGYGGGLSVISWFAFGGSASGGRRRSAEERVLVEGRRPGSTTWPFFDEAAAGASPTFTSAGLAERLDRARWSRERTSEAELHARGRPRRPSAGGTARKSFRSELFTRTARCPTGAENGPWPRMRFSGCGGAEAGGSPSSEASTRCARTEGHGAARSRGTKGAWIGNRADHRVLVS
jgi:hypothetical protein